MAGLGIPATGGADQKDCKLEDHLSDTVSDLGKLLTHNKKMKGQVENLPRKQEALGSIRNT